MAETFLLARREKIVGGDVCVVIPLAITWYYISNCFVTLNWWWGMFGNSTRGYLLDISCLFFPILSIFHQLSFVSYLFTTSLFLFFTLHLICSILLQTLMSNTFSICFTSPFTAQSYLKKSLKQLLFLFRHLHVIYL